jgi:hypothetical protein
MRSSERGSAMLMTMVLLVAILAGGAIMVSVQLKTSRSQDLTRKTVSATYCAEAGLEAARPIVQANYRSWNAALAHPGVEPDFLVTALGAHDIDGDGIADYTITLADNADELPPATNDPTSDSDLKIFIISTCIQFGEVPRQISELLVLNSYAYCYQPQLGGCGGNGNAN